MTQEVSIDFGANLILAERVRQVTCEGFQSSHDDKHVEGELMEAAICYAVHAAQQVLVSTPGLGVNCWPWSAEWWNPASDPIRNLVKAGALLAAEIDRLKRLELTSGDSRQG